MRNEPGSRNLHNHQTHEPLAQNAKHRALSHFADVACPVQLCVIRNLQLYPSSNECVNIWKSRLLLCLCESSRKGSPIEAKGGCEYAIRAVALGQGKKAGEGWLCSSRDDGDRGLCE